MRIVTISAALLLTACAAQTCPPGDKDCLKKQEELLRDAARQHDPAPVQGALERARREIR